MGTRKKPESIQRYPAVTSMRPLLAKIKSDFASLGNLERELPSGAGMLTKLRYRLDAAVRLVNLTEVKPGKLGLAVAIGFTIGLTPLYGLHLLVAILAAIAFRLNVAVVYAAAHVSIPPFIPLIAVACVQVGHYAIHQDAMPLMAQSSDELLKSFPLYWMLGSVILGPTAGGILGLFVFKIAARRKRSSNAKPDAFAASTERLYQAFLPDGRFAAEVLRGKVRHDVVYAQVFAAVRPTDALVDVGGGHGALPLLVAASRQAQQEKRDTSQAPVVIDWDEPKLAAGRRAAERLGVHVDFVAADVFKSPHLEPNTADCVTCLDVLHYASHGLQRELVQRMAAALKPGGRLIIRDMNADLGFRTFCTVIQEKMSLLTKRTLASAIVPRSGTELMAQLAALGLHVTATPCYGITPFSNTLWTAERPTAAAASSEPVEIQA